MSDVKWESIPFFTSADILGYMRHILSGGSKEAELRRAIPKEDIEDAIEIAMVYLGMYETWDAGFFGANVSLEAFRNVMMAKDQKLNLTNDLWKKVRLILEPVIANCTNACTTFESVYGTNSRNLTDEVIHFLYALRARRYDFVPWLIFVVTGSNAAWLFSSLLICKSGSGEPFEQFKSRMLALEKK